jgi:hypothetical protein
MEFPKDSFDCPHSFAIHSEDFANPPTEPISVIPISAGQCRLVVPPRLPSPSALNFMIKWFSARFPTQPPHFQPPASANPAPEITDTASVSVIFVPVSVNSATQLVFSEAVSVNCVPVSVNAVRRSASPVPVSVNSLPASANSRPRSVNAPTVSPNSTPSSANAATRVAIPATPSVNATTLNAAVVPTKHTNDTNGEAGARTGAFTQRRNG